MTQKVVTPSGTTITVGQIGKICDLLTAGLRKAGLLSESTQQVIETQGDSLVAEMVAAVRKRAEAVSNLIVRRVCVNRDRTPQEALDATGRWQNTDADVVKAMPRGGEGEEEVEVCFFKLSSSVRDEELEKEFGLRGLKPCDPYTLAGVNEAAPAFADRWPNATHWRDAKGSWCYAAFLRWDGERRVSVGRNVSGWWSIGWWFAGLRK